MSRVVMVALSALALVAGCSGGSSPSGSTDYSPYYVGTYAGTETVSITSNTTGQTSTGSYQVAFQLLAGAGASDLLFSGSCGLTGHASSPNNFITFQNTCTAHDATSNCDFTYNLQAGAGSKNGAALAMSIPGTALIYCPLGNDTGTLTITWSMVQQ